MTTREELRSFTDARELVRSVGLKNDAEWRVWSKNHLLPDIPSAPAKFYGEEWSGLGDWLGTFRPASRDIEFRSFNEARKYADLLGVKPLDETSNPQEKREAA